MTSKILFLGTEFESTRISDVNFYLYFIKERLDKIFAEMNYKVE
jgi:hypothetical protein